MAKNTPAILDDKVRFYRNRLVREVSNLFTWEGLPEEIPADYLERTLILHGQAMFFYDIDAYGFMALRCGVRGFNLYNQPTEAFAVAPNDQSKKVNYSRVIVHKYDEDLGKDKSAVLINNMYNGEPLHEIIDFYAYRLALIQQAFDTNAVWQNIPVMMTVDDQNVKLSLEKLFDDIYTGKPWIVLDKQLLGRDQATPADVIDVPFLLDSLFDAKNEVYNEFKTTIGLKASATDKRERLVVDEVHADDEITQTCLEVMLKQREIACEEIKRVFDLDISVSTVVERGLNNGNSDNGTSTFDADGEF